MFDSPLSSDIADLSILMLRMKYKDPNEVLHCHVLGTRAAAFLFLDGSAVCLLRARGVGFYPS